MTKKSRRPGGQPGNLNALKHGFYSKALDRAQALRLDEALALESTDLTNEIAMLRQRIFKLLEAEPDNLDLLTRALNALARLAATHFHLGGTDADRWATAMTSVLEQIEKTLNSEEVA